MENYSIYWIEEEFAHHYYHRGDILFRFIRNYNNEQNRKDLQTQFQFITRDFPKAFLTSFIKNYHENKNPVVKEGNVLRICGDNNDISLHIEKKRINFRCETIHDAETLLFPVLRLFQPYLFIVGNNSDNFGWISPVYPITDYDIGQVLYSCR